MSEFCQLRIDFIEGAELNSRRSWYHDIFLRMLTCNASVEIPEHTMPFVIRF